MDRQTVAMFIPIVAMMIPIVAIIMNSKQKVAKLSLEEARVRAGALGGGAEEELGALRSEVEGLRQELTEVQERLDFAERLLARPAAAAAQTPSANHPGR
jgi:hypothetical protein